MEKLTDQQNMIDEIAKLMCNFPKCLNYNKVGGCINDRCPTVDKAENVIKQGYIKQEWISVEDRLPDEDEYLTHHNDGLDTLKRLTVAYMTDTIEYAIGCYDGYKWLNQLGNRAIKDVIAWKPKPEPYESEDK